MCYILNCPWLTALSVRIKQLTLVWITQTAPQHAKWTSRCWKKKPVLWSRKHRITVRDLKWWINLSKDSSSQVCRKSNLSTASPFSGVNVRKLAVSNNFRMEEVRKMENFTLSMQSSPVTHGIPGAEPVPDWKEAKELWGKAWECHWIGLGLAFGALAVTSVVALVRSNKKRRLGCKPFVLAINSLLLILGVTRALYLFVDPYESRQNGIKVPRWISQLLYNIAFPCLTSAFTLIFLVFLGVAKLQLVSKRLQKAGFLIAIITFHFAVVLFAEVSGIIDPYFAIPLIICHVYFIVWGLLLSASFIYSGLRVIYRVQKITKHLQGQRRTNISKIAKVTLVTSCLGIALGILQLFSLISVYQFYGDNVDRPPPWMWWAFQTCSRLVELAMACTIAYSIMQPPDRHRHSTCRCRSSTIQEKMISEKPIEGTIWAFTLRVYKLNQKYQILWKRSYIHNLLHRMTCIICSIE